MSSHVALYRNFVANANQHSADVAEHETQDMMAFNEFVEKCFAAIPSDRPPANGYGYGSHAGEFVRLMSQACDEYRKAKTCFYVPPHT